MIDCQPGFWQGTKLHIYLSIFFTWSTTSFSCFLRMLRLKKIQNQSFTIKTIWQILNLTIFFLLFLVFSPWMDKKARIVWIKLWIIVLLKLSQIIQKAYETRIESKKIFFFLSKILQIFFFPQIWVSRFHGSLQV